jgi:hypothetical protein
VNKKKKKKKIPSYKAEAVQTKSQRWTQHPGVAGNPEAGLAEDEQILLPAEGSFSTFHIGHALSFINFIFGGETGVLGLCLLGWCSIT